MTRGIFAALLFLFCAGPGLARAEEAVPAAPVQAQAFTRSLLFSPAEAALVERALAGTVTGTSVLEAGKAATPIPQKRTIVLAGMVFRSESDWTAWINGKKVQPGKLLPEIVDIKVTEGRVELKWFDIGINGIISITLRPHQTYDIVTGVLLPG